VIFFLLFFKYRKADILKSYFHFLQKFFFFFLCYVAYLGWPWICDPIASFRVLELQVCATISGSTWVFNSGVKLTPPMRGYMVGSHMWISVPISAKYTLVLTSVNSWSLRKKDSPSLLEDFWFFLLKLVGKISVNSDQGTQILATLKIDYCMK
jgi:hypothetical protein